MWLFTVNEIKDIMRKSLKGNGQPEETVYFRGTGDYEISSAQWQLALHDIAHIVSLWHFMEKLYSLHCHGATTVPEELLIP